MSSHLQQVACDVVFLRKELLDEFLVSRILCCLGTLLLAFIRAS